MYKLRLRPVATHSCPFGERVTYLTSLTFLFLPFVINLVLIKYRVQLHKSFICRKPNSSIILLKNMTDYQFSFIYRATLYLKNMFVAQLIFYSCKPGESCLYHKMTRYVIVWSGSFIQQGIDGIQFEK